jgi:hypothetical protein
MVAGLSMAEAFLPMKGHTIRQIKRAKNRVKDRFMSQHQALAFQIPHFIYNP